ncbi:AAA family ATPase [Chryseobacterium sp. PMSZPI]|uniref:AAA family ATPase n=1 Tax=Chryseobacterium sp. PMSZPI TaxID=1033900 RepID=UPI00399F2144
MSKLYIMTGGPGAGKTSLLNELEKKGLITVPEEGRRIIKEQVDRNGDALPWMNKEKFASLMFEASLVSYQKMVQMKEKNGVFFDRGILDTIGYLRLESIPVPTEMEIKAREMAYHKNVFILPPWKEIYENDSERKQTFEVAIATFECMNDIYREYGYHVIEVPKLTIEQRGGFILDMIEKNSEH